MPAAAPIIAGAALSGITAGITGGLTLGLITGFGTLALGLLQTALAKKPSLGDRTRTALIRQPVTDRRLPFGEIVIGGVLTFYETTENDKFIHLIVTLGDAPAAGWDAIPIVWLNDEPIFEEEMDGDGMVISGKFNGANNTWIRKHLGGPDQTSDTMLTSEVSRLTSEFRGRGVAYLYIKMDWEPSRFPNGLPSIRAWCRTNTVLDVRDSTRRFTPNLALVLNEYLTDTDLGLGFDASDINDAQVVAAANTCDEIVAARNVGQAVVEVDVSNDELDVATSGPGAPVRIETGDRVEIFTDGTAPGGMSTGTSYYAIVERLVGANYDEDDATTISLSAGDYSGAAATAITDGAVDAEHGTGIKASIKLATSYANALARTAITITSAGSGQHLVIKTGEPRYAGSGVIEAGMAPKDAIEEILSGMAGRLIYTGGEFLIKPGAWESATESYAESDLMGALTVRTRHSRRERFNAVRGIIATQIAQGETTDYPPIIDSTFVSNDGGTRIFHDLDLPWTSRPATAQRIAKIVLGRHRREIRVDYPTGMQGLRAIPSTVVEITNARRSWSSKTFEVVEQEDLAIDAEGGDLPLQGVTLRLAELDSTAFDFDPSSDETIKPPKPILRGGNPLRALAPSGVTLASGDAHLFLKKDGTVVSRINVTWTTNDSFAVQDEVQFKKSASTDWQTVGLIRAGSGETYVWDVEDGESYDVRLRTINSLGAVSDWTQASPHQVVGKTSPPPDVDTFNVTRMADGTRRFTWTATRPADVRSGGGFQIREAGGTGVAWENMSPLHDGLLNTSPFETNELAAGTYTFGIKMVDSSDNESENARIVEATLGDPRLREVLLSRDEVQKGWNGTITDGFVTSENTLEATSDGSWSGDEATWTNLAATWTNLAATWAGLASGGTGNKLPDTWDALADTWQEILPNNSPMIYTTALMDLGTDISFTPIVSVSPSANVSLSMQTGTDADGGPVGAFEPLAAVTGKRFIKIRAQIGGTVPRLTAMTTFLDGETQVEDYEDVDTSAASAGVFERIATGHFKLATRGETASITSATIRAFQNAGSGWTSDLLSKATTITGDSEPAAEWKIYKDGTLTDAVIDAEIKGPKK